MKAFAIVIIGTEKYRLIYNNASSLGILQRKYVLFLQVIPTRQRFINHPTAMNLQCGKWQHMLVVFNVTPASQNAVNEC